MVQNVGLMADSLNSEFNRSLDVLYHLFYRKVKNVQNLHFAHYSLPEMDHKLDSSIIHHGHYSL